MLDEKNNLETEDEPKKEIEIITGDGSEISISPVYDHIKLDKDDEKKKKDPNEKIIIPKGKK